MAEGDRWVKTSDGRWVKAKADAPRAQFERAMRGFPNGWMPQDLTRRCNIITPSGHREVLIARIDAARRENRGCR